MKIYTTEEAVKCLLKRKNKNLEFKNMEDHNLEIFLCADGSVCKGEIGDGAVYKFNPEEYKNELWMMSLNPYR